MDDYYDEKLAMMDNFRAEEEETVDDAAMRHHLVKRFNEPDHVMMPGTQPPLYANQGIELMTLERMTGIEKLKKRQMRKSNYKQFQINVFNVLERPGTSFALIYHSLVFVLILGSLFLSILVTIPKFKSDVSIQAGVYYLEISLVIVFSLEYILRIWSCSCHGNYAGFWGKARFIKKPYMVIDIIVIVATTVVVATSQEGQSDYLSVSMFRFLRFLQVLRILRLDRQRGAFKIVSHVVYEHRQELLTCWYMSFILLVACSFLVYLAEKSDDVDTGETNDSEVQNLGDGLYWGIITLSTVGYGDFSPQNWVAKLITCIFAFIGTAFFALPAGILGSGFALQVAQNQKQKHFNRRRVPAALVIQYAWRFYAAHPSRGSDATWAPHQIPYNISKDKKFAINTAKNSPSGTPPTSRRRMAYTIRKKLNASRINSTYIEGDTLTSRRSSIGATIPSALELRDRCQSEGNLLLVSPNNVEDHQATIVSLPPTHMSIDGNNETLNGRPSYYPYNSSQELHQLQPLMEKEKDCIRFIRKTKLFIFIRKFKEECRPYDVKDVIEQYTEGQMEMFSFIKRFQFRMEGVLGIKDGEEEIPLERSLHFRVGNVEKKVAVIDEKLDAILQLLSDQVSRNYPCDRHRRRGDGSASRSTDSDIFCHNGNLNAPDDLDFSSKHRSGTVGADELTRRLEKLRYENSKKSLQEPGQRSESRFTVTPSVLTLYDEKGKDVSSRNSAEKMSDVKQTREVDLKNPVNEEMRAPSDLKSLIGKNESKYQSAPSLLKPAPPMEGGLELFLVDPPPVVRRPASVHFDESTFAPNQKQQEEQILKPSDVCNQCYLSGSSESSSSAGSAKGSPHSLREKISDVTDVLLKSNDTENIINNTSSRDSNRTESDNATNSSKDLKGSSSEPILNGNHQTLPIGESAKSSLELDC